IPKSGEAGRGVVVEKWQYEVFLTVLAADDWPAPEVVALYHKRSGGENRYAQEDRELGLGRIFSFHSDGQEFATVIGMMVWNLMIANGARLASPPEEKPHQPLRTPVVDERTAVLPVILPVES